MAEQNTPKTDSVVSEQIRFFLDHGKTDWAMSALAGAQDALKAELAASTLDAAASCRGLLCRDGEFEQWMSCAMALDPSLWERFAHPWARALVALSYSDASGASAFIERLLAAAPADIYSRSMGPYTVKIWLDKSLCNQHGDWIGALSGLEKRGYHPQKALQSLPQPPFKRSDTLIALSKKLLDQLVAGDYCSEDVFKIIEQTRDSDKAPLCLSLLPSVCYFHVDDPSDEDYDDLLDLCASEASKATLPVKQAMGEQWCLAMWHLAETRSLTGLDAFDLLASGLHSSLLDLAKPRQGGAWRGAFIKAGGKLAMAALKADALAEKAALDATCQPQSALKTILRSPSASERLNPRL